jgi:dTDP-4-dehydrorhamnose reductase
MRVLVIGAAGQLGQAAVARLSSRHEVATATRQDVDLRDHAALRAFVLRHKPEAIINCTAFNNVDGAEDAARIALEINAMAVRTLARSAADLDAVFFHFSTDFVFDGTASAPYTETDDPEPQSVYGQSKLVGEWLASAAPKHYVFRVESLFGGPHKRSSIDKIVATVRAGTDTPVFADRFVSPSFVEDVAEAVTYTLEACLPFGLYHCVNGGVATWLEVGREIARQLDRPETLLKPLSVNDVKLRAARPRYAALSNAKLAAAGFAMPSWPDAIARYLHRQPRT